MTQRPTNNSKATGISEAKGDHFLVDGSQFSYVLATSFTQGAFFFPILLAEQEYRVIGLPSPWLAQVSAGKIKSAKQRNLQHDLSGLARVSPIPA